MKKEAICRTCGKKFTYNDTNKKGMFCSRKCYQYSIKIPTKKCVVCGKIYTPDRGEFSRWIKSKYCSIDCLNKSKFKGKFVKCSICGKKTYKSPYHIKNTKYITCSKECLHILRHNLSVGKNNCMYGRTHTKEVREKLSKRMCLQLKKGIRNRRSISGKRKDLNNQFFRSTWEANYARYLNFKHIKWEFEPKIFEFPIKHGTTRYIPDFYLPETNEWVEVKGYMTPKSKTKLKRFAKYYPNEKLKLVDKYIYDGIKIKYSNKIKYWEYPNTKR